MAKKFDHIDNRFREAAENISIPPNEKAWNRMEELLDQEKRRRPVIFWWFLLVIGVLGGAGILLYQNYRSGVTVHTGTATRSSNQQKGPTIDQFEKATTASRSDTRLQPRTKAQEAMPSAGGNSTSVIPGHATTATPANLVPEAKPNVDIPSKPSIQRPARPARAASLRPVRNRTTRRYTAAQNSTDRQSNKPVSKESQETAKVVETVDNPTDQAAVDTKTSSASDTSSQAKIATSAIDPVKKDSAASTVVKVTPSKKKWLLGQGLNLGASFRLDATALKHFSLHQFENIYGGTLGYRFSNRLSIQTGLFVQKAVYYAGPEDYKVKPGTYLSMYRIQKVDAVCSIYDIPLSLRYDPLIGKSFRLFVNAGMNSYYLKREKYRYHVTGSSGYRMFDSSYSDNKDFFSSAYLSIGMEKKLSTAFSLQLEPYIKMPVSGIGAGQVKLYSAGAQLSFRFQPQGKSTRTK